MASRKNRRPGNTNASLATVPAGRGNASWRGPLGQIVAAVIILGGAVALLYAPTIHAPLIFDDGNGIVHNPSVKRLWPLVGDDEARGPLNPGQDFCTSGRPLVNLSFAINYRFSHRYDPTGYLSLIHI